MIYKYIFGTPIPTDAVLEEVPNKRSLYGAHNFILVSGRENFGLFLIIRHILPLILDMHNQIY